MIPVNQTKFSMRGNCFQACVASILELPLEEVPDFVNKYNDAWFKNFSEWLSDRGWRPLMLVYEEDLFDRDLPDIYTIVTGKTTRHPTRLHAVIYKGSSLAHDPMPTGKGLKSITDVIVFVKKDPSK